MAAFMSDTVGPDICLTHLLSLFDAVSCCVAQAPSFELFALCLRCFVGWSALKGMATAVP